jgi:hypothetical protein
MGREINFTTVTSAEEVMQILELQRCNLPHNLAENEKEEQGFVTVQHDPSVLKEMNEVSPSVIAKDGNRVIGYAMVMTPLFKERIPVLIPMFRAIENLHYQCSPLSSYRYFIMGQVCIAKEYRGQGIFYLLYENLRSRLKDKYELLITEVSSRNQRSLKAHLNAGLKIIHTYTDPAGERWELMIWDWKDQIPPST